ncbi:MAG: DUF177 domain-containing protein [Burkholderiaceae bacterium]|nr:MAG: DUF177 domain-containing protein [Burkholderiaceae bacterium]
MTVFWVDSLALTRPLPESVAGAMQERLRAERSLQCSLPFSALLRLQDALASDDGALSWLAEFSCTANGERRLRLQLTGTMQLLCQRCLGALAYPLEIVRDFHLVESEEEADRLFDADPEASIEPLVAGRKFDLAALIEDEIILALPAIRTHENCVLRQAGQAAYESAAEVEPNQEQGGLERPKPFAALSALKKGK